MEKALPAKRRRAAKGTVLFTVVAVMMVLIVFLMGTLALAATANNRAQAVYQKAQTEATARAVLEAAYQAIADDTTATGIRSNVTAATTTTPGTVDVRLSDTNQTYRVEIYDSGDTKSYYDPVERKWDTSKVYRLSVTVDKTKADTTYNAFITAKTETTPGHGNGGGGGGAFVSMGTTSTIGTGGYITGGSYLGVDETLFTYTDTNYNTLATFKRDANGKLELDGAGNPIPLTTTAYKKPEFTIADNEVMIDAPYYINGNVKTGTGQGLTLHFTQFGDLFYVNGNFVESQTEQLRTDYTGFIQPSSTDANYKKTPYIFVEGELKLAGNGTSYIGQKDYAPTNLYVNRLNCNGSGIKLYGDIYMLDPDAKDASGTPSVNVLGTSSDAGNSKLYEWTKTAVTNSPAATSVYGNLFSRGDLEYYTTGQSYVQGDLRCEKNVTFKGSGTMTIDGDLVVGGTLKLDGCNLVVGGSVYADSIDNSGNKKLTCENDVYTVNAITGPAPTTSTLVSTSYWYEAKAVKSDGASITTPGNYDFKVTLIEHETINGAANTTTLFADELITNQYANNDSEANNKANEWAKNIADSKGITVTVGDNNAINNHKTAGNQYTVSGTYAKTPQHTITTSVATQYGKDIYPAEYTLTTIKTTISQSKPVPSKYDSYYTNSATFTTKGTEYTTAGDMPKETNGTYYELTESSWLHGTATSPLSVDKNIHIVPTTNIRVILENVDFGSGHAIIVDDSQYQVEIYIIGTVKFTNSGAIATEYYWKNLVSDSFSGTMGGTYKAGTVKVRQLHKKTTDEDYPNVIIMSDPNATLDMSHNHNLITGMVRAPQLTFSMSQAQDVGTIDYYANNSISAGDVAGYDGSEITYGSNASTATYSSLTETGRSGVNRDKITKTGLIGQLIAQDINLPNDADWGMVYVDIPSGTIVANPPTPPSTNPFAGKSSVLFYDYY